MSIIYRVYLCCCHHQSMAKDQLWEELEIMDTFCRTRKFNFHPLRTKIKDLDLYNSIKEIKWYKEGLEGIRWWKDKQSYQLQEVWQGYLDRQYEGKECFNLTTWVWMSTMLLMKDSMKLASIDGKSMSTSWHMKSCCIFKRE